MSLIESECQNGFLNSRGENQGKCAEFFLHAYIPEAYEHAYAKNYTSIQKIFLILSVMLGNALNENSRGSNFLPDERPLLPSILPQVISQLEQKLGKRLSRSLETKLGDGNLFIKYTGYSLLGK